MSESAGQVEREPKASDSARRSSSWGLWAVIIIALAVALFVFLGLFGRTTVPDLYLKTSHEAAVILDQSGLAVGTTSDVVTSTVGQDRVAAQQPPAGTRVWKRSSVDVSVAAAPTKKSIPNVVGTRAADASQTLSAAGFLPRTVEVYGTNHQVGSVFEQVPASATAWLTGQPVGIEVAGGPAQSDSVKVPSVVGQLLDPAARTLQAQGLAMNGLMASPTSGQNVITEQAPAAGSFVKPGTTVLVIAAVP